MRGVATKHENREKQRTMMGVRSFFCPRRRTYEYAIPAPAPPITPAKVGISETSCEGCAISTTPKNAITVVVISTFVGFSLRIGMDAMMAKNGESLLSIFESARGR